MSWEENERDKGAIMEDLREEIECTQGVLYRENNDLFSLSFWRDRDFDYITKDYRFNQVAEAMADLREFQDVEKRPVTKPKLLPQIHWQDLT